MEPDEVIALICEGLEVETIAWREPGRIVLKATLWWRSRDGESFNVVNEHLIDTDEAIIEEVQ